MVYRVLLEISSAHFEARAIRIYSIIAVIAIIIKITFFSIAAALSHKAAYEILHKLRIKMASKLLSLPLGYFVNKELGATKKTINEDVEKLELYIAHNIPRNYRCISFTNCHHHLSLFYELANGHCNYSYNSLSFYFLWINL